MSDRERLDNLKGVLDTLITTCKSEVSITDKIISKTKNTREISKLQKERAIWKGKLELTEYIRKFL